MTHREARIDDDDGETLAAGGGVGDERGDGRVAHTVAESSPHQTCVSARGAEEVAPEETSAALHDRLLRIAAKYDNYRKRMSPDGLQARTRAKADLIERLLGPLDDLRRVAHP